MFIAPIFSSNFAHFLKENCSHYLTRMLEGNSSWQKKLELSSPAKEGMNFVSTKKTVFGDNNLLKENHMWEQDGYRRHGP